MDAVRIITSHRLSDLKFLFCFSSLRIAKPKPRDALLSLDKSIARMKDEKGVLLRHVLVGLSYDSRLLFRIPLQLRLQGIAISS